MQIALSLGWHIVVAASVWAYHCLELTEREDVISDGWSREAHGEPGNRM